MGLRVDDPKISSVIESNSVRVLEEPVLSPVLHQAAVLRENLNRNFAAIEGPDISIGTDGDAGHGAPFAAGRLFFRPARIGFVSDGVVDSRIGLRGRRLCQ